MKDFLKLLVGFLPWIAFGVLAGPSLVQLEVAMAVSLALSVILGYSQLKKGFILPWGTVLFFVSGLVLVLGLKNVWYMRHLGILSPASLAAITWISLALGRPFVLDFAKESTPKELWDRPEFRASCYHLTIVWGILFICSTLVSWAKYLHLGGPDWVYGTLSFATALFGMAYTEWFKKRKRREREVAQN